MLLIFLFDSLENRKQGKLWGESGEPKGTIWKKWLNYLVSYGMDFFISAQRISIQEFKFLSLQVQFGLYYEHYVSFIVWLVPIDIVNSTDTITSYHSKYADWADLVTFGLIIIFKVWWIFQSFRILFQAHFKPCVLTENQF